MTTIDYLATNKDADKGTYISIQCLSEEDYLNDLNKKASNNTVMNRMKLLKGSTILFNRAIKANDALKDSKKYVVVNCK